MRNYCSVHLALKEYYVPTTRDEAIGSLYVTYTNSMEIQSISITNCYVAIPTHRIRNINRAETRVREMTTRMPLMGLDFDTLLKGTLCNYT